MSITGVPLPLGPWRGEGLLIVSHSSVLPPNCVKCGKPTKEPSLKRRFSWHPPWVALLILFGILPYVIVAMATGKRMTVDVPLCSKHREKYKALRLAGIMLVFGSIAEFLVAGTLLSDEYQGLGITGGILAVLAGLVCLVMFTAVLRTKYIDDNFGYFRNVNANFLNLLPPRPPTVPPH